MHRFPSREPRAKPKPTLAPIYTTRNRSLSALQPSHLHVRASTVVRKVLGARELLKEPVLFVDPIERASCDKPRSSADSTRREARPRSNTTPTEITWPKDITTPSNNDTVSAPPDALGPTSEASLPVDSLLFSLNTPPTDDQDMLPQSPASSQGVTGSPEMYDSGYASGQSSAADSALPAATASPAPKTPRSLGRTSAVPLTPGGMNMRLSPSVTRSMMPMPILNLPPLPAPPAPEQDLPRTRSLQPGEMRHVKKSMPVFMRHGTSNMPPAPHEEEDDDDGSTDSDSDSSDTEEAVATGDSSPETRDSLDDSIEGSIERSSSEDTDYFDAREAHTPATDDPISQSNSGLVTPRASEQNRIPPETSALGLQINPISGPSIISGSPWTVVDASVSPGADRAANGHGSRMDYFSHPVTAARQVFKSPHRTPRVAELLSLASPSRVNVSTPRANPVPLSPVNTIAARRARASTVLRDPNGDSPRPALYQQVSHSMMNLSSPVEGPSFDSLRSPLRTPRDGIPATPGTPVAPMTPLIRRNSMPTMIRHPPTYKDLYPSVPREEEGKEKLPPYSCGIHIEGMMPRKMEFTAPGVLAKDRSWKKQYIVLHGTSLLIYKNDIRKVPIGGKVKGKEKYEGVVTEDEVDLNSPTVHLPGHESVSARPPLTQSPRRASRRTASNGTTESGSRSSLLSRLHGNSSKGTIPQQEPEPFDNKGNSSQSTRTVSVNTSSSSSTTKRWSHNQASGSFASSLSHFNPPFSSGNALVRHYTLQKSESGLGSDYYKRRNVIRVRCEGEQFLLQADSVMQVVDWIEALQAGTNVALDLDERPMTKPPPFPRRRRRRRARPADGNGELAANPTSNDNTNR